MITRGDFFMGRDVQYASELTPEIEARSEMMIRAANVGLSMFYADNPTAVQRRVNSGWRPPEVNAALVLTRGAAVHSHHMDGDAVDLSDVDRALCLWSMRNKDRLLKVGILGMERPESTPDWCHWQQVAAGSGVFVFWPSITAYEAWQKSGKPLMVP